VAVANTLRLAKAESFPALLDRGSIGHHPCVAHGAGKYAQLDLPLFPNDVMHEGNNSLFRKGNTSFSYQVHCERPPARSHGYRRLQKRWCAEDCPARFVPFGLQLRFVACVIQQKHRLLLLQPLHMSGRLTPGSVDGILLVDFPDRNLVVAGSGNMFA
jgi:hypothetical protein